MALPKLWPTKMVVARLDGKDIPLRGDILLAATGIQLNDATSFEEGRPKGIS